MQGVIGSRGTAKSEPDDVDRQAATDIGISKISRAIVEGNLIARRDAAQKTADTRRRRSVIGLVVAGVADANGFARDVKAMNSTHEGVIAGQASCGTAAAISECQRAQSHRLARANVGRGHATHSTEIEHFVTD